jgi:hypothetical protein
VQADLLQNWHQIDDGEGKGALLRISVATVVNVGIGFTPFLDNFAHLGGMLFGFLAGLVLMPQPPAGQQSLTMGQRGLQVVAGILALGVMAVALIVLYTGIDAVGKCHWCSYVSCISTPWWCAGTNARTITTKPFHAESAAAAHVCRRHCVFHHYGCGRR